MKHLVGLKSSECQGLKKANRIVNPVVWSYSAWRIFFLSCGVISILDALPLLFFSSVINDIMYHQMPADHRTLTLLMTLTIIVVILGIGNIIISRDPRHHTGLIVISIMIQATYAVLWYYQYIIGYTTNWALASGLLYSVTGILFGLFLRINPEPAGIN